MTLFRPPRLLRLFYSQRTWGFSIEKNLLYLTFDDGPTPEITPWILDELKKENLKATFFCVGENVKRYPKIYERILNEGHVVGNHTHRHENSTSVQPAKYLASIEEADKLILSPLFRPPYGRLSPSLARKIAKKYNIIMWSWLSYDFDPNVPVEEILNRAKSQLKKGDILVLHDNAKTADRQKLILPEIIKIIKEKGFDLSTIPIN